MYLFELDALAERCINNKVYVVPCDRLPSQFTLPFCGIINYSKAGDAGTHWVSLTIMSDGTAFFMDSYGLYPQVPEIQHFIRMYSKRLIWNKQQLQRINSRICGLYALISIYFLINRNSTFGDFISQFTKNLFLNDKIVENMYAKLIKKK